MSDLLLPTDSPAWFRRGIRDAIGLPLILIMATMCGIGGLASDVGYPAWAATLSTLLIWAGPAQVILFGAIGAGAGLPTTAFAIWLSSSRFLPMTISLLPLARRDGQPFLQTLLAAHLVSMTTWVEGLRRLPDLPKEVRSPYFFGFSCTIILGAALATHVGYYIYALVPKPLAAALLFITPVFFSATMVAGARAPADWVALVIGFLLTPLVMQFVPSGMDFLVVGFIGGTAAFLMSRRGAAPGSEL